MEAFDWKRVEYYYDKQYPKARAHIPAWKIHQVDPKRVLWLEVYRSLSFDPILRRRAMERLHIFTDEHVTGRVVVVPDLILKNVSNQIRQVNSVPKSIDEYTQQEKDQFPALFDLPKDFIVNSEEENMT